MRSAPVFAIALALPSLAWANVRVSQVPVSGGHSCESGLLSGVVTYAPEPVEPPAEGNLLICCSQPRDDVVLDL